MAEESVLAKMFPTFAKMANKGGATSAPTTSAKPGKAKKSAKVQVPQLPIVNLLPPRLEIQRLQRSTKRGFLFAGVAIIITAGALWSLQTTMLGSAQQALTTAKANIADAEAKTASLADVKAYYEAIDARKEIIAAEAGQPLDYPAIQEALFNAIGPSGTLNLFDVKLIDTTISTGDPNALAASCGPVTDPFAKLDDALPIACFSFAGYVPERSMIPGIATSLKSQGIFGNISVMQAGSVNAKGASFTGTGVITDKAVIVTTTTTTTDTNEEGAK